MDGNCGFCFPNQFFQDAATHFNFHEKLQVSQNYLLGGFLLVVRIHLLFNLLPREGPDVWLFSVVRFWELSIFSEPSSMRLQGCLHTLEPLTDLVLLLKWYLFSKLLAAWLLNLSCWIWVGCWNWVGPQTVGQAPCLSLCFLPALRSPRMDWWIFLPAHHGRMKVLTGSTFPGSEDDN